MNFCCLAALRVLLLRWSAMWALLIVQREMFDLAGKLHPTYLVDWANCRWRVCGITRLLYDSQNPCAKNTQGLLRSLA